MSRPGQAFCWPNRKNANRKIPRKQFCFSSAALLLLRLLNVYRCKARIFEHYVIGGENRWVFADKARSRYIVIVVAQPQAQAICHNCSNWTGTRFACLCFQNLIRQTMAGRIMAINKPISLRPRTVFSVLLALCLAVESSKIPVPLAKQHKTGEGKN